MKFKNKILAGRNPFMMRLLGILVFCIALHGTVFAGQDSSSGQYACLYNSATQTILSGDNVLFPNQILLTGISYDTTTGVFTLQPGTYSVTYFSDPGDNLNLVANGSIVPNAPLGGSSTILILSNEINTVELQAQRNLTLSAIGVNQCNAMITIYQIK